MKTDILKFSSNRFLAAASSLAIAAACLAAPASAVVPNDNQTPEDIIDDEEDVTGVGMFYRADGFVCSGTLINPRTVLFAAHCVNDLPMDDYGTSLPSAWSFRADALPGFVDWINNDFSSNPDAFVYNINQVIYNLQSLQNPQGQGFLEGDIALSSLDTPAANIPTWALLFSPLPAPESIDPVSGTGYHVDIMGYGATGSGTTGASLGVDFRRRAAENMLGALTSMDDRDLFLFGVSGPYLPQVLYTLDFDDPVRTDDDPTTSPSPYDFNLFKDDPLENEGTTAGGDSGGPLVLDAANNDLADEDLVIGVLSGGGRFFGPQVFSSYGTQSYYQPLFLFWDWVAANNPYRYASAAEGDGAWEDGSHWVTMMDPAYRIIDADGNVVSGVPTSPGNGIGGTAPTFGEICFEGYGPDSRLFSDCQNLETGEFTSSDAPAPAEVVAGGTDLANARGKVGIDLIAENAPQPASVDLGEDERQDSDGGAPEFSSDPLPDPTLENGLPGATGFVPNNIDPDLAADIDARYFDVTLSASGTTSLSSAVEIDRLTLSGPQAGLDINSGGSLTSLIEITQTAGTLNVDAGGMIATPGDYLLFMGLLSGSGTVSTPYFTNVAGGIAPGGMGTTGTLTIDGDAILSSGSVLLYDATASDSDLLAITGDVSLGGNVAMNFGSSGPAYGQEYTLITYDGTSSGALAGSSGFGNGVLFGSIADDGEGTVTLSVDAEAFADFIPAGATPLQRSYAAALDDARMSNYDDLSDLFGIVDLLAPGDAANAFTAIAPGDTLLAGQSSLALGEALNSSVSSRLRDVRAGRTGFVTTASSGSLQLASTDAQAGFRMAAGQMAASEQETQEKTYEMKSGYGGFLSADFYQGETETGLPFQSGELEGYVIAGGLDRVFDSGAALGLFVNYAKSENTSDFSAATADIDGISGGVYGHMPLAGGSFLDGYASYGDYTADTSRTAALPGGTLSASASTDATVWTAGAEFGRQYDFSGGVVRATPSVGFDYLLFDFDAAEETGSGIALDIDAREITSSQLWAGGLVDWDVTQSGAVRMFGGVKAVYDLDNSEDDVAATFAPASSGTPIVVGGAERSELWFELEAGVDFDLAANATGSLSVKPNIGRDGLDQTMLGASLQLRF